MRLGGKVAIIAGGANGIGRATAALFAREGASVVIADRDAAGGDECVRTIENLGGKAFSVQTDLSSDVDVEKMTAATLEHFGGIDILVNCAAIGITGGVVTTEPARWQRVIDVNLTSVYRTCHHAIPHMIRRGGGSIVNIASVHGIRGWPHFAAYATSKAGMIGLTRQIAVEYAAQNIRANTVSPGQVFIPGKYERHLLLEPTLMNDPDDPSAPFPLPPSATSVTLDEVKPRLCRPALPEDIAYAILFLASDEAAQVTAQNLVVDGGATARGAANR